MTELLTTEGARPHHPYEGSQPDAARPPRRIGPRRSSSPLRGVATGLTSGPPGRPPWGPHHPYEGSQHEDERGAFTRYAGPHHPYEGSQLHYRYDFCDLLTSSSPLRGVATRPGDPRWPCPAGRSSSPLRGVATGVGGPHPGRGGPHHPYEGSQPVGLVGDLVAGVGSSSPLRGVATWSGLERCFPRVRGSSSPLRGVATALVNRYSLKDGVSPHHPYEGSQLGGPRPVHRVQGHRSSSPLRGVATGSCARRWT